MNAGGDGVGGGMGGWQIWHAQRGYCGICRVGMKQLVSTCSGYGEVVVGWAGMANTDDVSQCEWRVYVTYRRKRSVLGGWW